MSGAPAPAPEGAWVVAGMPGGVLADAPPTIAFSGAADEGALRLEGPAGILRLEPATSS